MRLKQNFLVIPLTLSFLLLGYAESLKILKHGGSVESVRFSPIDAAVLASAGDSHTLKIWDLRDDTVTTLRGHTAEINSVAFSPDGRLLVSGGDDWTFKFWDVNRREHIATLEHVVDRTRYWVDDITFSPNGHLLATASKHIKLWNVSTQTEVATLRHDEDVEALAFSPDGEFLAAGDGEGSVKIWDVQKRDVIAQLQGDTVRIYALDFSPDGRTLASAGYDGFIKLWAVSDWALLGTLENKGTVFSLDFSANSKVLASTGYEVVTLWSVESGEDIASLTGHLGWVKEVAFSPDGKTLASGGDAGSVRVQNIESYLQTLQQREMVRLLYFLPLNRRAQRDINTKLDTLIKDVQAFYAQEMQRHGFGRKTFTFETDTTGSAVVYHVNGRFTDAYYDNETSDKVFEEIEERFDVSRHIYLIFIESGTALIDTQACGAAEVGGGLAIMPASGDCFLEDVGVDIAAHELGHAFGLQHDFSDDAYIMSYGSNPDRLSYCAADWLNVHRYFNTTETTFNEPTTIQMHTPIALPSNTIRLRFEVTDADGLHQAQLMIPTLRGDPGDGVKLQGCQALDTETAWIEFTTAKLTAGPTAAVELHVMDVNGRFTYETYPIRRNDVARVDVNSDGIVDIDDLVIVASNFGQIAVRGVFPPDVNNDGKVNQEDLLLVADVLEPAENNPAAPAVTEARLQHWILMAKQWGAGDEVFQRGIAVLEQLLAPLHPRETMLLPNYPNPFNPETYIPYELAKASDVKITIYDARGRGVRHLQLGHQVVGYYTSRNRAAYWDGRNTLGELVASGVYFYTITAGDFTATRKMLIRK